VHSRRAVGSLIGIGFLLMIITLGLSYYNTINMIESSSNNIFLEISDLDKKAVDEVLEIQSVKLTVTNSLNLTIKNTGSVLSSLRWIGVFDDSLNTKEYYSVDTSLNPAETQIDIGNSSITINPSNTYTIQVLTKLGNIYYGEYPEPPTGDGSGGETGPVYSNYETADIHADTAIGTHSLFGAMKTGPDEVLNTLSEGLSGSGSEPGASNQTLIDNESFEGSWPPSGWTETPGGNTWNRESDVEYHGSWSADFDGGFSPSGNLESPILDCSDATSVYVTFWYYDDDLDAGDFELEYYDGSSWDLIADLGTGTEDTWHNYQHNISDPQYMVSDFQVRWVMTGASWGEHAYVDLVNIIKTAPASGGNSIDATGGYMLVGDGTPDWGSSTGTISFWVKWDTVSNRPWGQHGDFESRISGSNLVLDWGSATTLTSTTSFTAGNWYFIAITWNEATNNLILYVGDESTAPSVDASTGSWFSSVSTIGVTQNNFMAARGGVDPLDGHGDDLRYWDTDRSLVEIQGDYDSELSGSETNLRSYFKLNNDFNDVGPDNNDGSGSGSYSFSTDVPFSGTSYMLDLEVRWSDLISYNNEFLMVYGVTQGSEALQVDVWDGIQWVTVINDIQGGWNTVDVSSYLSGSTFSIRFKDTVTTSDATQDSWEIDALVLNLFD